MLLGLSEGARDVVGLVDRIGIGEEEMTSAGGLCAGPSGVALACESSVAAEVQRWRVEQDDAFVVGNCLSCDRSGVVGRVVVDDDQLPLLSEGKSGFRLAEQRVETGGKRPLLVAGWDDDRNLQVGHFGQIQILLALCIVHDFVL